MRACQDQSPNKKLHKSAFVSTSCVVCYLPFCFLNPFNSGHIGRPEPHPLGAAAGHRDDLVLGNTADREIQISEKNLKI